MILTDFKTLLSNLIHSPSTYTSEDFTNALECLFSDNPPDPVQIGAFLLALHTHRIEMRDGCLEAAAKILRKRAMSVNIEGEFQGKEREIFIVDIVGTGGDGHDTFNVSTSAAIVAAGAGARVMKHGARAATSSSGSADLLQSLGIQFSSPSTSTPLPRIPFTFLLASLYHPSLSMFAPIRRALPFRTIFNLLGPLINPVHPQGMILGVPDPSLGPIFARALKDGGGGTTRAMVVCGAEGLDEISCAGITYTWTLSEDGEITEGTLHPERDFGIPVHPLTDVKSSTPVENARILEQLLTSGTISSSSPVTDFILINASALLVIAGIATDFKHGVTLGRESMSTGKAWDALQMFKAEQNRHVAALEMALGPTSVSKKGVGQQEVEATRGFGWQDR